MGDHPDLVTVPAAALKCLLAAGRARRNAREQAYRRPSAVGEDTSLWILLDADRQYQALCGAIGLAEDALGLAHDAGVR